jgi:hypothetical protein
MAKVKAHDGHPRKHAHGGEVAKISNTLADLYGLFIEFDIINYEDERCEECYTNNIAQDNLSMETVELRDNPIDNEDNGQGDETDSSKDGEHNVNKIIRKPVQRLYTSIAYSCIF